MRVVDATRSGPGGGAARRHAAAPAATPVRQARDTDGVERALLDNPVHDTVALATDLRRHLAAGLRRHRGLRAGFAPLVSRVPDGGATQAGLAGALGLSDQAVSGTIALATDAGFVRRVPHPDDGRSKLVVLTERGRRLARHSNELIVERRHAHAAVLGEDRVDAFVADLGALYRALGRDLRAAADGAPAARPEPDALGTVVPVAAAAVAELHRSIVQAGHPDVRRAHASALLRVGAGARPSALARALGTSRQSAGAALAELEALGYVRRSDAARDRRAVVFTRTARGDRFVEAWAGATERVAGHWQQVLGDVRWRRHVDNLHDLRVALRLGDAAPARSAEVALGDLADDLVRRLGIADARTLAHLLDERTAPRSSNRRTTPTKEASA